MLIRGGVRSVSITSICADDKSSHSAFTVVREFKRLVVDQRRT
jgi:hypothetical protein